MNLELLKIDNQDLNNKFSDNFEKLKNNVTENIIKYHTKEFDGGIYEGQFINDKKRKKRNILL